MGFYNSKTILPTKVVATDGSGDYNTLGDGASNVQINAAITAVNAAGGGVVILKPGTYTIADRIILQSKVELVGSGADTTYIICGTTYYTTSTAGPSGGMAMVVANSSSGSRISDVTMSGFTLDMNEPNLAGSFSGAAHHNVDFWYGDNIRFSDCKCLNGVAWTIYFNLCTSVWIERNYILGGQSTTHNQNDGIHVRNTQYFFIRDNYVNTNGSGTGGDDCIVFVTDTLATADTAYGTVTGNVIGGSGSRGIISEIGGSYNVRDVVVADNVITNTKQAGIKLYSATSETGIYRNIVLSDNVIYNAGMNGSDGPHGIYLAGDPGGARAMFYNIKISDNAIRGLANTSANGIYGQNGIIGLAISGNTIETVSGYSGITLGDGTSPVKNFTITGNKVDASSGNSSIRGLQMYDCSYGTIGHNYFLGVNSTTGNGIDICGITGAGHMNISGNYIQSFNGGIVERSSGSTPDYDLIIGNNTTSVTTATTTIGSHTSVPSGTNLNG